MATIAFDSEEFRERGVVVLPGMITGSRLQALKKLAKEICAKKRTGSGHWNTRGFLYDSSANGQEKLYKVQGLAVEVPRSLEMYSDPDVLHAVQNILHFNQEASKVDVKTKGVDIFGTKFYPLWPAGGRSVHWHQDSHFFGTYSSQIVSCGFYIEDTDKENGCFRCIPGSHREGVEWEHVQGQGEWAQGEWVEGLEDGSKPEARIEDVPVPAGSVVLFDPRLLHAARPNTSADRTRFSFFGHYVVGDLAFSWAGDDFSRGKYADRHTVLAETAAAPGCARLRMGALALALASVAALSLLG